MPTKKFHASRQPFGRPLIAVLAGAAGCGAWAQEASPYYIGLSESVTYSSNVYGIPDSVPLPTDRRRSDIYGGTGVVAGFDQLISRQRVYAAAKANMNRYAYNKDLNNVSYDLNGGWDWATIERLSGSFVVDLNQSLANNNNFGTVLPTLQANTLNTELFSARVRWGGDSDLNLDGAYAYNNVRYSVTEGSNSSQNSGSLGVSYAVGPTLRLGVAGRLTRAVQPNYAVKTPISIPPEFDENVTDGRNLDLTADWKSGAQASLNTRVSWTSQTNSLPGVSDYSGMTGALSGTFAPTAKLTFTGSMSRDAGINSLTTSPASPGPGQPAPSVSQSSQITGNFALGVSYAATAKIGMTAGVQYQHNKVPDPLNSVNATNNYYSDNTLTATLGANYAITRNWSLACNLSYASRDVSGNLLPYSYSTNIAGCTAQLELR